MTIKIAIRHSTNYRFDRLVTLSQNITRVSPTAAFTFLATDLMGTGILIPHIPQGIADQVPAQNEEHQLAAGPVRQLQLPLCVSQKDPGTEY